MKKLRTKTLKLITKNYKNKRAKIKNQKLEIKNQKSEIKNQKLGKLRDILEQMESVLVAFSGGVDSSFLLKVARDVLGKENVLAVTARSQTYTQTEYRQAKSLAKKLGVTHLTIRTEELNNKDFRVNPLNRCFYCKNELFARLKSVARKKRLNFVLDGANYDDSLDYRPGSQAARQLGVSSPLREAKLSKSDIRSLARKLGLPNWNKPAQACLASRFPYRSEITPERLRIIGEAENYLWKSGFRQVRVRFHKTIARIEVGENEVSKFFRGALREKIAKQLKKLGFKYVTLDLEGYRTGSLNP